MSSHFNKRQSICEKTELLHLLPELLAQNQAKNNQSQKEYLSAVSYPHVCVTQGANGGEITCL